MMDSYSDLALYAIVPELHILMLQVPYQNISPKVSTEIYDAFF
jgi:hypothetical protein